MYQNKIGVSIYNICLDVYPRTTFEIYFKLNQYHKYVSYLYLLSDRAHQDTFTSTNSTFQYNKQNF